MAADHDPDRPAAAGERDLAAVIDALLREAQELKRQWGELHRALGGEAPGRERARSRAGEGEGGAEAPDPRRLIALEMLLAGRSRDEVEAYLKTEFGDEAAAVVDDVFGGP